MLVRSKSTWGDRHEADREHDVVDVGDHGAERELPFEPEPKVDQDAHDREHQADHAVGEQFAGDARSHHLDATIVDGFAERAAHFRHRVLLRLVAAGLLGDADQDFRRTAELLQLHLAEAKAVQGRAHRGDVGGAGLGLHLQQRAALEVDAEIQAVGEEQRDGKDREQRRDREADAAKAGEVEMGVVRHDAQRRQQAERRDHGQDGDQDAKANENGMCHNRPLRSARFAAASTAPSRRRSGASG
ncbi:hypothetical protein ABIF30_007156 [Bradyrhizobium elkanii]